MGSPLLAVVPSRRLIKIYLKVTLLRCLSLEYYLMVSDVQRTHGSKGLFELLDNNYPHGGIQNTMQNDAGKLNVMEGHDTWNDSHVVTSTKKAKFQTSYDSMI